jgi:putative endonuclease
MKRGNASTASTVSSRSARGGQGEAKAAALLGEQGYTIRARNFRSRFGEIDIVAEKGDTVVFVEVKSWAAFGEADLEFSIGRLKRRRIVDTARVFLFSNPGLCEKRVRFDVLLIPQGDSGRGVRHIEDAFSGDIR